MKAILIDDEKLILELLHNKLKELSDIEVIGKYTNPHQGLIAVSRETPDVLFLDISMPEISGLEIGRQLKVAMPNLKIVFLTAFEEYAVEAFEIDAEDYVLKPFNDERLLKTLDRIKSNQVNKEYVPKQVLFCLGKLSFGYLEKETRVLDVSWRTNKSRDVFAFLLHHRGRTVRKDILVEEFWSDLHTKEAFNQLYSAIYQIRKMLERIDFQIEIKSVDNGYRMELNDVLVDVDIFEKIMDDNQIISSVNARELKKILQMYKGDYFGEENYLWALHELNRLRLRFLHQLKKLAAYYTEIKDYSESILLYLKYQEVSPYTEESYYELIQLYVKIGERHAAEKQFLMLKKMLLEEYGKQVSEETNKWFYSIIY